MCCPSDRSSRGSFSGTSHRPTGDESYWRYSCSYTGRSSTARTIDPSSSVSRTLRSIAVCDRERMLRHWRNHSRRGNGTTSGS